MGDTYVECLVKQKNSLLGNILKWVLILVTVLCAFLGMLGELILIAVAVAAGFGAYYVGMRSDVEYEYLYLDRELSIDRIMRKTKRKRVVEFDVERMEIIAPIHSHRLDSYRNRKVKTVDYSIGEAKEPDKRYVMYYNGEQRILLSPSSELLKAIYTIAPRKVFMD